MTMIKTRVKPYILGAFVCCAGLFSGSLHAQLFSHDDTLRGSITPERAWWDLQKYELHVQPDIASRTLSGRNTITYKVIKPYPLMQIDLQKPLQIDSVKQHNQALTYTRDGNAYFIRVSAEAVAGATDQITVWYHGTPRAAKNAPWDGGIDWKTDSLGNPWVSSACQGLGASAWWPTKDHQYDEPDSGADIYITVPDTLMDVSNGRLKSVTPQGNGTTVYHWEVKNPINNYDIEMNVGKYAHWSDTLLGEKGILDLNFYVLSYNLERAKVHFAANVKPMLHCFEYWMGPYPFYEDGYKLVETHNLGMEHQSGVDYGNRFMNGYRGRDLSGSGWGLKWDFIIVHESGHEWFGNNITSKDIADMWVHEGFTDYSETLFTDCQYGKAAGDAYCQGLRRLITNDKPIIGHYNVNEEGSEDMYYKGANMLNTIRAIIGNDEQFRGILRGLSKTFYHQTVTTEQIERYIGEHSGFNCAKTFDQYLRTTQIPVFHYRLTGTSLTCHWANCVSGFDMPVRVLLPGGKSQVIHVTEQEQTVTLPSAVSASGGLVDPNVYVMVQPD